VICFRVGVTRPRGSYGQGQGSIWYDFVHCFGTEGDIRDCPLIYPRGYSDCGHGMDAGVSCSVPFTKSNGKNYNIVTRL